jgi:2-phospho-L-lactate guanylyltransferase
VSPSADIWAIVPIKELDGAKQRLAPLLSPAQRRALIEVMMGEVLEAVAGAKSLAGILVVTLAPEAAAFASRLGARVVTDGARDDLGSNAVICSPPDSVPLRFGDNSYFPHLEAARRCGIEPTVIRQPGIAMDIDHPVDLAAFLRLPQSAGTRTRAFLEEAGIPKLLIERGI